METVAYPTKDSSAGGVNMSTPASHLTTTGVGLKDILTDAYNISKVDQNLDDFISNVTDSLGAGNVTEPENVGNFTSSLDLNVTEYHTNPENSTLSIILQTLKDSIRPDEVTSEMDMFVTTSEPEAAGFTSMQHPTGTTAKRD